MDLPQNLPRLVHKIRNFSRNVSSHDLFGGFRGYAFYYYEAPNDYTNKSETSLLCNRCACNWELILRKIVSLYNSRVHRKDLMKAPELHKRVPAQKPCVTDVLCDLETYSPKKKMCHRCPTYQLHLPPKRDLGTPKTLSKEMPENSGKFRVS